MSIELTDIQKLSVSEKVALYQILESDPDVTEYTRIENDRMLEEIKNRDKAYEEGKIKLTSIKDLENRLHAHT